MINKYAMETSKCHLNIVLACYKQYTFAGSRDFPCSLHCSENISNKLLLNVSLTVCFLSDCNFNLLQ